MKNILFLTLVIFTFSMVAAQSQEYVVTLKNDTIYGKVIIAKYDKVNQQVSVKSGKEKNHYKAYETKTVITKKGIFRPLKIKNRYQFAKLEKEGYLSYYKYSENSSSTSLSFNKPLLVKKSGEQIEVPNLTFKKQLAKFLSDCEGIQEKFEAGEYSRGDLDKIITDYNLCIDKYTAKIITKQTETIHKANKASQIEPIKTAVNSSSSINSKQEIFEMLNDVQTKIKAGEKIPNYLIEALKEKLSVEPKLLEKLLQIIR